MKIYLLYIAALCFFTSCENGRSYRNSDKDTLSKISLIDSTSLETLNLTADAYLFIKVIKTKGNELCMEYQLKGNHAIQKFCFKYFDYSNIIFPDTSVAVMNKSGVYKTSNYHFVNDSILILPIIGMNNFLSVYILDLRSKEVISSDIRTHFSLVWVNDIDNSFILTDSPSFLNDTTYEYKVRECRLAGKKMALVKRKIITMPAILRGDTKGEREEVMKIW